MFGMMVITNAGAALVRLAQNLEKKIVFTRSYYGSSWDDSRADLANKPIEWYDVGTGTILGVSAGSGGLIVVAQHAVQLIPAIVDPFDKDHPQVIGEAQAETAAPKPVKAVCICAQIKKDGADPEYDPQDDVIFAATCNDNSCFTWADPFTVDFDLPIPMSAVVDDTGSTSGDYVTLDTEQTITGEKTIDGSLRVGETREGEIIVMNDDLVSTIAYGVKVECSSGVPYVNIQESSIIIGDREENELVFYYTKIPLKAEYNTTNKTIDLTLGNGTVVRLTCTNVEENPA